MDSASARPCFDGTTRGSSRISGLSRHVAVVNLALVCVGYSEDPTPHSHTQGRNAQKQHRQGALAHGDYPSDSA